MIIRVKDNPRQGQREMSEEEDRYWRHVLSGDPMFRNFLSRESMFGVNPHKRAMRQPICPKCERAGFFHKGGMACAHCGYMGMIPHNLNTHLKEGHYR